MERVSQPLRRERIADAIDCQHDMQLLKVDMAATIRATRELIWAQVSSPPQKLRSITQSQQQRAFGSFLPPSGSVPASTMDRNSPGGPIPSIKPRAIKTRVAVPVRGIAIAV